MEGGFIQLSMESTTSTTAPTPAANGGELNGMEVKEPVQVPASTDFTPGVKPGKQKTQKRKRTLSGLNVSALPIDIGGTGGRSSSGGRRERSGTVSSATMEPMLMYPVYDGGVGASPGAGKGALRDKDPRNPRMQSVQICQRILNHLLCDGALSLDDLSVVIPEVPRENLMAILEILDVLGVVMCIKCKQPPIVAGALSESSKSSSGKSEKKGQGSSSTSATFSAAPQVPLLSQTLAHRHTNETYYAIVGFAKGTEFTQFTNLKEQLKAKRGNIHKIHSRVQALDELTRGKQPHTRVERLQTLKRVLDEFSSSVQDDQLYRALLDHPDLRSTSKR